MVYFEVIVEGKGKECACLKLFDRVHVKVIVKESRANLPRIVLRIAAFDDKFSSKVMKENSKMFVDSNEIGSSATLKTLEKKRKKEFDALAKAFGNSKENIFELVKNARIEVKNAISLTPFPKNENMLTKNKGIILHTNQ